jgi:hypothetical protein
VAKSPKKIVKNVHDKRITKILKPIQEEGAQGSASSSHYKHVFKRCHQDLKQMMIGPHTKSVYMRSPEILNELLNEIIEIKASL